MFAWFRSSGEILRENIVSSAELFERSIQVSDCRPENERPGRWPGPGLKSWEFAAENGANLELSWVEFLNWATEMTYILEFLLGIYSYFDWDPFSC